MAGLACIPQLVAQQRFQRRAARAAKFKHQTLGSRMDYHVALRRSKLVLGLAVGFWLLVSLVLVASSLVHAHVLRAVLFGTLPLLCLGYSLYGAQFSNSRWRVRSIPHRVLWCVVAIGAAAGVTLVAVRFLV